MDERSRTTLRLEFRIQWQQINNCCNPATIYQVFFRCSANANGTAPFTGSGLDHERQRRASRLSSHASFLLGAIGGYVKLWDFSRWLKQLGANLPIAALRGRHLEDEPEILRSTPVCAGTISLPYHEVLKSLEPSEPNGDQRSDRHSGCSAICRSGNYAWLVAYQAAAAARLFLTYWKNWGPRVGVTYSTAADDGDRRVGIGHVFSQGGGVESGRRAQRTAMGGLGFNTTATSPAVWTIGRQDRDRPIVLSRTTVLAFTSIK